MLGFSTADGFMNVKEGVDEMIKHVANEPSVGLFYVQQHAHSSMPYLLNIRDKIVEKVHDVTLHTDDTEDSIYMVRSMTECGLPIADQMIKDISRSLQIMSASQPKSGLTTPATSYFSPFGSREGGGGQNYLSSVFNSAKQKAAAGLKWPKAEQLIPSTTPSPSPVNIEADELPVSSSLVVEKNDLINALGGNLENQDALLLLESYDKFRFDREAKLEEWLREEELPEGGGECEAGD